MSAPPPYELRRSDLRQTENKNRIYQDFDDQSHITESDIFDGVDQSDSEKVNHQDRHRVVSQEPNSIMSSLMFRDNTETIHHVHNLLLYLLSNPEDFQEALDFYKSKATTSTLSAFHAEIDRGTDVGSLFDNNDEDNVPPIPFMVFAPDAEVVLPQAHTASQLFGFERDNGMELEATSGIIGLCQLFMRWLKLMPDGDHMNLISPPGLTVMRIAGGRYRVTAPHRVVWTWNNQFAPDPLSPNAFKDDLKFGDLVTMTIVDVFETDCDGKVLSYCPTFDNRAVFKTDQRVEKMRKGSSLLKKNISIVANSPTAAKVNEAANLLGKLSIKYASTVKETVQRKIEEELKKKSDETPPKTIKKELNISKAFEEAFSKVSKDHNQEGKRQSNQYGGDEETTTYTI